MSIDTEKISYASNAIINATIKLLETKPLEEISVSDISAEAGVSRNSYYRNFPDKESIIRSYLNALLDQWDYDYNHTRKSDQSSELYLSFFSFLKDNEQFFLLLRRRNLFYLFREVYLSKYGPKVDQDNVSAYVVAFIQNGMLGWVDEWIERGMQEPAQDMAGLISKASRN